MEHSAGREEHQAVVQGCYSDRRGGPGKELQLPTMLRAPARVEVQDGCDAPGIHCLITVIMQWETPAITCSKPTIHPSSTYGTVQEVTANFTASLHRM